MEEELFKLFYVSSMREKEMFIVRKEAFKEFIDIVIDYKNLKGFIDKIVFLDEIGNGTAAFYEIKSKSVYISINSLVKELNLYKQLILSFKKDYERFLYINCLIAKILLHEFEHINQIRKTFEENDLESQLLKFSLVSNFIDYKTFVDLHKYGHDYDEIIKFVSEKNENRRKAYSKNRDMALEERLAEIHSGDEILNILSYIKEYIPKMIDLFNLENNLEKVKGYEQNGNFISSPTLYYFQLIGYNYELYKFDWFDMNDVKCLKLAQKNIQLEDRIRFGLPLEEGELTSFKQKYLH